MPAFGNELPAQAKHMGFDLRRTPTDRPLQAIITCDDFLVCDTHYWHGRTLPCERRTVDADGQPAAGNCPACIDAMPYRTHVYVSAFDAKTHEHFIFECTANAAKAFAEYRQAASTLRGCAFNASRPKAAKNSKVVIVTNTANLARIPLPEPPNLIKALCTIWRIPTPKTPTLIETAPAIRGPNGHAADAPTLLPDADLLKAQREQLDDAGGKIDIEESRERFLRDLNANARGNGHPKSKAVKP